MTAVLDVVSTTLLILGSIAGFVLLVSLVVGEVRAFRELQKDRSRSKCKTREEREDEEGSWW